MFTTRNARRPSRRRGMILMVVLAMLTLFAIVGISFVLVANSQESAARIAREAETQFKPGVDPEAAFFFALSQLLYDVKSYDPNSDAGVYSALRGHSLARSMYGWYDATENQDSPAGAGNTTPVLNDKPFTGFGRLSFALTGFGPTGTPDANPNDLTLVNYLWFKDATNFNKLRDPERYPMGGNNTNLRQDSKDGFDITKQPYVPMAAVPYTYPDHNNFFLAAIDPATGQIACPSFHRPYLFPLDNPGDPLWTDKTKPGALRTVRPLPVYHTRTGDPKDSNFPRPIDGGGDVKNLDGVPGGCDSIWIDIGAPVMKAADGRRYKMLAAPLIIDLDGRIDLNVVGNLMGKNSSGDPEHRSNQGWGPWEVNPQKVLNTDASEWRNLFIGYPKTGPSRYLGRYDTGNGAPATGQPDRQRVPFGPTLAGAGDGNFVRGWAQVDYNGAKDYPADNPRGTASDAMGLPSLGNSSAYFGFPNFGSPGQANEKGYRNGAPLTGETPQTGDTKVANENDNHASLYWPYNPRSGTGGDKGRNYRYPVKDLVRLLRDGGTGADLLPTDLRGLVKGNLWTGGKRRNLVTLLSADLDRPGATPYIWDRYPNGTSPNVADSAFTRYGMAFDNTSNRWVLGRNNLGPVAGIPFPNPKDYRLKLPPASINPDPPPPDGEFDVAVDADSGNAQKVRANTWRHNLRIKGLAEIRQRINLSRDLPDYPTPDATTGYLDMDPTPPGNNPTPQQDNYKKYKAAADARQKMADDIWKVLRSVTGAADPVDALTKPGGGPDSPEFYALRALAQIAVNIVDYVDNDDVMTVFKVEIPVSGISNRVEWFYGFELPRLVLNEAYVQYDNEDGSVTNNKVDPNKNPPPNYVANTWVELMNPLLDDQAVHKKANLLDTTARLTKTEPVGVKPIYRIVLCDASDWTNPANPSPPALQPKDDPLRKPVPEKVQGDYYSFNGNPVAGLTVTPPKSTMSDWTTMPTNQAVLPMDPTNRFDDPKYNNPAVKENNGFLLVGPPTTFNDPNGTNTDPGFNTKYPKLHKSEDMRLKIKATNDNSDYIPRPRVVLQRLANPALPEQRNPQLAKERGSGPNQDPAGLGYFNDWVTIDYIDSLNYTDVNGAVHNFVQKGRLYDVNGKRNDKTDMEDRVSVGRTQPYAASNLQLKEAVKPANPTEPTTTFYRQNSVAGKDPTGNPLVTSKNNVPGDPNEEPNLKLPFDWLVHLDRKVVNPFELWHVSGVAPWLVTQDFVERHNPADPNGNNLPLVKPIDFANKIYEPRPANQHAVPWADERTRLYRFFEFVTTGVRGSFDAGNPQPLPMDRVMGKVNINTVWNRDVFRALADAQASNSFYDSTTPDKLADDVFAGIVASRSQQSYKTDDPVAPKRDYRPDLKPTDTNLASALGLSTKTEDLDRPFWSFAIGYGASAGTTEVFAGRKYSDNNTMVTGLQDTLFRGSILDVPDSPPTPTVPGVHARLQPYQKKELLRKVFANLTTRSNVFGVWLTVGFFEVEDDAKRPVILGKEIGKAENRHVRYRMFALVDRTQMKAFDTTNADDFATPAFTKGDEREVKLDFSSGMKVTDGRTGREWELKDDVYVTYEPGADNEETVRVYVKNGKPYALFQRSHGNKCRVICRGNPGPMSRYNPRDDAEVVPFFM
ncbi:MAG: hypothetical protein U0797_27015, partial [Gemmataceae bacterium]